MSDDGEFYKNLIDNLYDGVYFVDRDRRITYWNNGAERITGYEASKVIGRSCRDNLLNHVTTNGCELCLGDCPLSASMEDGKPREAEVYLHHANGHRVPVHVRASPIRNEKGEIVGAVETFSNNSEFVSERMELTDLRNKIQIDPLTGLRNRLYLERRLQGLISQEKDQVPSVGLLFIDIDHFKEVNDQFGHEIGDQVLKMVTQTMSSNLRGSDVVGRWGGEEFLVIVYDITTPEQLKLIADKIRTLVQFSHLDIGEESYSVTVSIGGTMLLSTDTPESFVSRADRLMYQSKQAKRNQTTVG